jgi:CBS domain-containing protein
LNLDAHDPSGEHAVTGPAATPAGAERRSIYSPLSQFLSRSPITCPPGLPVRQVLARVNRLRVGAIVIADPGSGKPLGIFTVQDFVQQAALPDYELDQPVERVMTQRFAVLGPQASAHDAALTMARQGLGHLLVVGDGKLLGVVSQHDLFSLPRTGLEELSNDIRIARDTETLAQAANDIRLLAGRMLHQGTRAETLTQLVSTLDDLLTIRVIELELDRHSVPEVPMCWIALGSEGRFEQTFSTDQDNGIIFEPPEESLTEEIRRGLLPFARAINQGLDACGFPLCRGNIMAGNPQWCLSLAEWKDRFGDWIMRPVPQALLHSTIFFDFRAIYGDESLVRRLRDWLSSVAPGNTLFLRYMAEDALTCEPPLGVIRDFVFDDKAFPRTINLKMYGSRPFVDAARILALAHGVAHTNTAERLRAAAPHIHLSEDDLNALTEAFYFIQMLRLRQQMHPATPAGAENRIDPDKLNQMERQLLKESFRQAQKAQARLKLSYAL